MESSSNGRDFRHRKSSRLGFGAFDAANIASAIDGSAQYFVTTDDGVLKRADRIAELRIVDPLKLISIVESKDEY